MWLNHEVYRREARSGKRQAIRKISMCRQYAYMTNLPYQKLTIWQKGMSVAVDVYRCTKQFPAQERYGLTQQMQRSAVSVPSNIAEGSQRTTDKDFSHFIAIARGSLAELETQIMLAQQLNYIEEESTNDLQTNIEELKGMLYCFQRKLIASR